MPAAFKVAVLQAVPVLFDMPKTMAKLDELMRDAAGKGAQEGEQACSD